MKKFTNAVVIFQLHKSSSFAVGWSQFSSIVQCVIRGTLSWEVGVDSCHKVSN